MSMISLAVAAALVLAAAALPLVADPFLLSVMTLVFLFAYLGQSWNIIMGFAGQLSLGHALFVGLGGYSVAVLMLRYGISPWIGIVVGALISAAAGALIGFLGFRFSVRGIYFALLTIAFAEFARVLFDNWSFVGSTAGLFLPAISPGQSPFIGLRGGASFYYYFSLVLLVAGTGIVWVLSTLRFGYLWRAIREDEDAARAMGVKAFRMKILAASISAAMASVGGSFLALMNGSLFPGTIMGMSMSVQIILAPIVGGLGTVLGPVVGSLIIVPLMHASTEVGQSLQVSGLNTLIYGVVLLLIIMFVPDGVWSASRRGVAAFRRRRTGKLKGRGEGA